jgi:hypothetical protein
MLERVFNVGEEPRFVEQSRRPKAVDRRAQRGYVLIWERQKDLQRHVTAYDRRDLERALVILTKSVDAGSEHRMDRRRDTYALWTNDGLVSATLTDQDAGVSEMSHRLFNEKGVPTGPFGDQPLYRFQLGVMAENRLKEILDASCIQTRETHLAIVR